MSIYFFFIISIYDFKFYNIILHEWHDNYPAVVFLITFDRVLITK